MSFGKRWRSFHRPLSSGACNRILKNRRSGLLEHYGGARGARAASRRRSCWSSGLARCVRPTACGRLLQTPHWPRQRLRRASRRIPSFRLRLTYRSRIEVRIGQSAHRVRRAPARERQDEALPTAEVLVPPDQQRAIAHLMRLVRAGTFDGSRLPVDRQGESVTPAELVVPPLTIEPIEVPNVEIPTSPVPAGRNSQ